MVPIAAFDHSRMTNIMTSAHGSARPLAGLYLRFAVPLLVLIGTGCAVSPPVPYSEPAAEVPTANVRLITNAQVSGAAFSGCPVEGALMAQAGRFSKHGMSSNYPQHPQNPSSLNMSPRVLPALLEYMSPVRMANGPYREVAVEYKVPAGIPFAFHFNGATAGGFSSTHLVCPVRTGVFEFAAGEDYDVGIGMMAREIDGKQQVVCVMTALRLLSIPGTDMSLPLPLAQVSADEPNCKK